MQPIVHRKDRITRYLLDTADAALYEAKKKGRNQYIIKNIVGALRLGDKMYAAKK